MAHDDQIRRLAREIDAARKTEPYLVDAEAVANLRRQGAGELHQICAQFVFSVNSNLSEDMLDLSPATYDPSGFRETGVNLSQIGSQGRQMQTAFNSPRDLFSTKKLLVHMFWRAKFARSTRKCWKDLRSEAGFYFTAWGTERQAGTSSTGGPDTPDRLTTSCS